ncbi:MAG: relaxase/mobilization nuclease domain-containing protein [Oscillospiraceae bacterium]|jgi:hypothetical protein|nr:relaxase/mobilization nuclease domain-containing protein [Oscillospiraceae bacterium]
MATTTIIPLHIGKGKTSATVLTDSAEYMKNPAKTHNGEFITGYECDPLTAAQEFLFARSQYAATTGRRQGASEVVGYHLRQSFKPGEIDAATANRIGYEMAMSLTKGKYAFLCCTHEDKAHIHSHILVSAVSLDCTRKFRNFKKSAFALRKISDRICLENGLSVIEKPKPSRGSYGTWLGDEKQPSNRGKICEIIDAALVDCKTYDDFINAMLAAGCEVKQGKYLAFKIPGGERFARCTEKLGADYTEDAIRERISGERVVAPRSKNAATIVPVRVPEVPSLLIDIQAKIRVGAGEGYQQWMKIFNLKQAARTLIFLQEVGIDSYAELQEKSAAASSKYYEVADRIKEIEKQQKDINELQAQIGTYTKTRGVYVAYKTSGWDKEFFEANRADITLHRAAKKHFNEHNFSGKLPSINSLRQEWATLESERKSLYRGYKELKEKYITLGTARANANHILGIAPDGQVRENERELSRRSSYAR